MLFEVILYFYCWCLISSLNQIHVLHLKWILTIVTVLASLINCEYKDCNVILRETGSWCLHLHCSGLRWRHVFVSVFPLKYKESRCTAPTRWCLKSASLCCSQTQQLTEPIKQHLQQLESSIQEQLNQLSVLKATVLQNDQHIHHLLTGSNTAAVK